MRHAAHGKGNDPAALDGLADLLQHVVALATRHRGQLQELLTRLQGSAGD